MSMSLSRKRSSCVNIRVGLCVILCLLVVSSPSRVRADREPVVPPATAPSKVAVSIDTTQAPELNDWAIKAKAYAETWYPVIAARLASDGFTPPDHLTLLFTPDYKGVAMTRGTVVTISQKYVTDHPDDFGMVAHEITHVVQQYRIRNKAGWLVEGIADYVRYYVIEPGSPRARFDIKKSNWNSAYQPSAAFLNYVETTYPDKHVVSTLNEALRKGKYKDELFKTLTGKDPDELWNDFKESRETHK